MNKLYSLLLRDLKSSVGLSWHLLVSQLVMPIVYIFVLGLTFSKVIGNITISGTTISYVQFLAVGVVFGQLMLSASYAGAMVFFDKRMGMFEQILAGPFKRYEYFASKILSVLVQGLFGSFLVLIIASPLLIGLTPSPIGILYIFYALVFASLFLRITFSSDFSLHEDRPDPEHSVQLHIATVDLHKLHLLPSGSYARRYQSNCISQPIDIRSRHSSIRTL